MNTIRTLLIARLFVVFAGGVAITVEVPQSVSAADTTGTCHDTLLTFPAWFKGLTTSDCSIMSPADAPGGVSGFIWTIVLNVIDFLLQLVAYISTGFIIVGGFGYLTSAGFPDKRVTARKTIVNAIVGLGISIFSVAIVNVVSGSIK